MASERAQTFEKAVREYAYEVRLDDSGALVGIERHDGQVMQQDLEPGTNWWHRRATRFVLFGSRCLSAS